MVSIGIMTLITGVVVTQFAGFDSAIITKARAYNAAQTVRAAQAYATQVRATSTADTTFTTQYLARFTKGSGEMLIMRKEGANEPQTIEYRGLSEGYRVQELCIVTFDDATARAAPVNGQILDISFMRPEVAAFMTPQWINPAPSVIVRSYVGITGSDTSLIHWVEVGASGSVAMVLTAPSQCTTP